MYKYILIILFLLYAILTIEANAQVTTRVEYGLGAPAYITEWADIDSNTTYYSNFFDISAIDGQTIYYTGKFTKNSTEGVTNDTVRVVIEGAFRTVTNSRVWEDIDTFTVVGVATYTAGDLVQGTLSLSAYYPEIRYRVEEMSSAGDRNHTQNSQLTLGLYAKSIDNVFVKP